MPLSVIKNYQFPHNIDSSTLLFWAWNSCMPECFDVVKAWGFTYRTVITWVKPKMDIGNYCRNATEHIILATKGNVERPEKAKNFTTWFIAEKREHSRKPEYQYEIAEMLGQPPYLELFARRRRDGWLSYGNELAFEDTVKTIQSQLMPILEVPA
jgi:N6-adenosine-specific RNA methylase IME4